MPFLESTDVKKHTHTAGNKLQMSDNFSKKQQTQLNDFRATLNSSRSRWTDLQLNVVVLQLAVEEVYLQAENQVQTVTAIRSTHRQLRQQQLSAASQPALAACSSAASHYHHHPIIIIIKGINNYQSLQQKHWADLPFAKIKVTEFSIKQNYKLKDKTCF